MPIVLPLSLPGGDFFQFQENRVDVATDVGKLGAEWEEMVKSGSKNVNGDVSTKPR